MVVLGRYLFCVVVVGLFGNNPAQAIDDLPQASLRTGQQILWKVQSQQNTVFLAGSIHVLKKKHYPLAEAFDEAFIQSSRVMFEVDLDGVSSPTAQMDMVKKGLFLNGETLPKVLSAKNYARAKNKYDRVRASDRGLSSVEALDDGDSRNGHGTSKS